MHTLVHCPAARTISVIQSAVVLGHVGNTHVEENVVMGTALHVKKYVINHFSVAVISALWFAIMVPATLVQGNQK